jgi:hypothetical protein
MFQVWRLSVAGVLIVGLAALGATTAVGQVIKGKRPLPAAKGAQANGKLPLVKRVPVAPPVNDGQDGQNGQDGEQGEAQNGQAGEQGQKQNGQAGEQGEKQNGQAGNQGDDQNGQHGNGRNGKQNN